MKNENKFGPTETILKAQAGDGEAVAKLFDDYRPMLLKAVSASAPGLTDFGYTVDDLMQEASVAMSAAITAYDGEKGVTFGAYARICVRNRLISIARKAKRVGKSEPVANDKVEQSAVASVTLESLDRLLTPYEREVFGLMFTGYKPAEIAAALDRPVKSVYNAVCRIKAKAKSIRK